MAYRVSFTRRARRDLELLWESINAPESPTARRWFARLEKTIGLLATSPRMRPVTHEDENVRHVIFGNKPHFYRVLYEIEESNAQVDILSIWHGKRLPPGDLTP